MAPPGTRRADEFAAHYDAHFADVHRYIAGRLGRDVADDIAADTFVIALRGHDRYDPAKGSVRPWLFGIATNLVAQHRRQERRRYRALAKVGPDAAQDGHEDRVLDWVRAEGLQPRLAGALRALPAAQRDVLLLSALGELTNEEIAAALDIPYGTVASRLSRARAKVRAALGEDR
ncbi:RNA polymerase sigma factor [Actinomadura macrotermitis]|uniref:ECF RNA polymerase sigma factor SigW n=1 Tax=Actinomadura macrotermitis TaxID=2585200 RepID=A0A7K0BU60_9ACTN|nr:ECF RNA polymerase sigma factor SigW [Actinomadura macrotermitis]